MNMLRYIALSVLSGLLFAAAWPAHGFPFLIFFAFVPLLLAEHRITRTHEIKRQALTVFLLSFLSFFIWNILTTWWLFNSLNPGGTRSWIAGTIPNLINPTLMALLFVFYHFYRKKTGTYFGLVFFVVSWICFEKMHLSWELTWPWLNLGNAFAGWHEVVQWYDATGTFGGTLWVLVANVMGFYTVRIYQASRKRKELYRNIAIFGAIVLIPVVVSLLKYKYEDFSQDGEVDVVLLQPALDPYQEKYSKDSLQILGELLQIAKENAEGKVDFFIAPETAIPGVGGISERGLSNSLLLNEIADFTSQYRGASFVTGASTYRVYDNEAEKSSTAYRNRFADVWMDSYNAALQIVPGAATIDTYHKGKLVPGVEIFPYMKTLEPVLGNAMLDLGGTVASLGTDEVRKVFANPYNNAVLAPIICYESIYGEFVTGYVKNGANLLAIVTNDSWWGYSPGHRQLLAYAKLRAIETRKEVVRSANSGVSALINAKGDVVETLPYGAQGALKVKAGLHEGQTAYVRYGDVIYLVALFVFGFMLAYYVAQIILAKNNKTLAR